MTEDELVALFRRLGAPDPEGWAGSQVREGIRQLPRFVFLRQAWRRVVDESDPSWMEQEIAWADKMPHEPTARVGQAIRVLRSRGASDREITDLVRGMQANLLFGFCSLLDDGGGEIEDEVEDLGWALVETNEVGDVIGVIDALHESVYETDPTGREKRPRERSD